MISISAPLDKLPMWIRKTCATPVQYTAFISGTPAYDTKQQHIQLQMNTRIDELSIALYVDELTDY